MTALFIAWNLEYDIYIRYRPQQPFGVSILAAWILVYMSPHWGATMSYFLPLGDFLTTLALILTLDDSHNA